MPGVARHGGRCSLARERAAGARERRAAGRAVGCDESGRGGFAVHVALAVRSGLVWLTLPLPGQQPEYPDVSDGVSRRQRACSAPSSICSACAPPARPTRAMVAARRLAGGRVSAAQELRRAAHVCAHCRRLSVRAGARRGRARDPGGPGARGDHRAGSLPLLGRRRARAAPRRAARLHAQGHREALRVAERARRRPPRRPRQRRLDRRLRLGLRDGSGGARPC